MVITLIPYVPELDFITTKGFFLIPYSIYFLFISLSTSLTFLTKHSSPFFSRKLIPEHLRLIGLINQSSKSKSKEGIAVKDVLIQEGVYSFETVVDYNVESVAEPVVYLVDKYVVGGFYRIHAEKGLDENLNTPGMKFFPIAFEDSCQLPASSTNPDSITSRLYFYGVIARLATLAAAREIQK